MAQQTASISCKQDQAAPGGDGASGAAATRGGTGAAPRNTAPDTSSTLNYQPLRWGIDSLYLSYAGELSEAKVEELKRLKALAQGPDHEAAKAQIVLDGQLFTVKDKGSKLFAFSVSNNRYTIQLSASQNKRTPMAYVRISSGLLAHVSPRGAVAGADLILRELGEVGERTVSRADLFVDFASDFDMESWRRDAWITKAHDIDRYSQQGVFTGWSIGKGGPLMARLYHKLVECRRSDKTYLLDLWRQVGWDGEMPVWRLEFQFNRELLAQLHLTRFNEVYGNLPGLWDYASTRWLKLTQPNLADSTRSRWPLHPLWLYLGAVDWGEEGGPLTRTFPESGAPSLNYLGDRTLSLAASIASVEGLTDFDAAMEQLWRQASNALGNRYTLSGLSLEQGFAEMVEICNRKYNVRLNAPPEEDSPPSQLSNPYYRAKEGL